MKVLFSILLLLIAQPRTAGQDLQEAPSDVSRPESIQVDLLDPARRTALEEALKSRNYTGAEKILVEEIERKPKSPQLLALLGNIFFLDRKYLNSASAFLKAQALSPLDERSRFTLAMAYVVMNRPDWARPVLEKLVETNPKNVIYPYWLARLDYSAQQFSTAISKLEKVLELDPEFVRARDNLGLCYEALGRYEEAITSYQEAVRLNRQKPQNSPWPPLNLGTLLLKLGKIEEAETYFRESLRYDSRLPQTHYQLGLFLEKQERNEEAIRELKQASAYDPSYAEPQYALARIYRRIGDNMNAEVALNTFQKLKKAKRPAQVP